MNTGRNDDGEVASNMQPSPQDYATVSLQSRSMLSRNWIVWVAIPAAMIVLTWLVQSTESVSQDQICVKCGACADSSRFFIFGLGGEYARNERPNKVSLLIVEYMNAKCEHAWSPAYVQTRVGVMPGARFSGRGRKMYRAIRLLLDDPGMNTSQWSKKERAGVASAIVKALTTKDDEAILEIRVRLGTGLESFVKQSMGD